MTVDTKDELDEKRAPQKAAPVGVPDVVPAGCFTRRKWGTVSYWRIVLLWKKVTGLGTVKLVYESTYSCTYWWARLVPSIVCKQLPICTANLWMLDTFSLSLSSRPSSCVGWLFFCHRITEQPRGKDSSFCPQCLMEHSHSFRGLGKNSGKGVVSS